MKFTRTEAATAAGLSERQRKMAERIQARAIRRYGELLKQIEPDKGGYHGNYAHDGTDTRITRTEAATQAGISERQKVTAMRIANIPDPEFDALIESDSPRSPPVMLASKVRPTRAWEHQNLTKPDTRGGLATNSFPAASRAFEHGGKFSTRSALCPCRSFACRS